jgi:hypothetical protein
MTPAQLAWARERPRAMAGQTSPVALVNMAEAVITELDSKASRVSRALDVVRRFQAEYSTDPVPLMKVPLHYMEQVRKILDGEA